MASDMKFLIFLQIIYFSEGKIVEL